MFCVHEWIVDLFGVGSGSWCSGCRGVVSVPPGVSKVHIMILEKGLGGSFLANFELAIVRYGL